MGRRKERRLAAMGASGRRVKLDLFAEPSGDLGGSSTLEEVGGEGDSRTHAEIPSSPSSSGQQPQNPLMLLGQYSDEDLDEDSNTGHNHTEEVSVGTDEQTKTVVGKEAGDGEINHGKESSELVEQFLMDNSVASQDPLKNVEKESITEIGSGDLQKPTNTVEEASYPAVPDEHVVEDVSSGWKMVLHEESNQYYYWNVATGETSWEVPDALPQEIVEASEKKAIRDAEGKAEVAMGTSESSLPLNMGEDDITTKLDVHSKINSKIAGNATHGENMDGPDDGFKSDSVEGKEGNIDANQEDKTSLFGGHSIENQSGTDLSSQLIKHCKGLLERLNSEKCLDYSLENRDLKLKCKVETEIRLADINALASHGSYLLPFWLHSETQLKRLEAAVDSVAQRVDSASTSGFQATLESREGAGYDTEIDSSEKKGLLTVVESHAGDMSVKSTFEAQNNDFTTTEHVPLVWCSHPNNMCGKSETKGTEEGSDLNPKSFHHSIDDMDMDVDMEVEETSPLKSPRGGASEAHYVSTDISNVQNTFSDREPTLPGVFTNAPGKEWIPPPPSDNEPIPPPPPDDEPFPPPPPDEPPEAPYPPSHLGSVQAFSYADQYALSYPGSGLEYYVQTNPEVSGAALYTHSEGGQIAPSHVPHFYEAASNVYAVAPVIVNPVEATTYYGLQNGTFNPVPLVSSATESSGTKSGPALGETGTAESLDSHPESGSNLLLKNNIDFDKSCHAAVKASQEVHEARPSLGAPATSTVSDGGSDPSTSDTAYISAAAAAAASAKAQSKVPRTKKKRTVAVVSTLRSNKKVSTLVDKWKAAKEELHDEEEEPEDPYEILEKKRQREIEQWRAQQIASGEAKDNANFQPLGGDWRERVKRRRAEKMKESRRSSPDDVTDGNPQTNLSELSKGLPSGWQAYWDDSSKQVYYGNVITSETTWTRPTA